MNKTFVALSVYLDPVTSQQLEDMAGALNQSKSGAAELLIKKGLGLLSDVEVEDILHVPRRGAHK